MTKNLFVHAQQLFCTLRFSSLPLFSNLGVESLKHHTPYWMMHILRKNHGVEEKGMYVHICT